MIQKINKNIYNDILEIKNIKYIFDNKIRINTKIKQN